MNEYSVEIFDNHIIALIDGKRVLLDTGAPNSISDGSHLTILGEEHSFSSSFMGYSIDKIAEMVGTGVNVLLGFDILGKINFFVDWDKKILQFSSTPFEKEGEHIPLEFVMNVPVVVMKIDQTEFKMFLDTGAKLSYLNSALTKDRVSLGKVQDFYMGFGRFETETYEVMVVLGDQQFNIIAGNLPGLLQTTLMMANTQGILGSDLFKNFNVYFNYQSKEMIIVRK